MIRLYGQLLKQVVQIIRRDPMILVPYLMAYLVLFLLGHVVGWNPQSRWMVVVDWLLPIVLIHPLVLAMAANVRRFKTVDGVDFGDNPLSNDESSDNVELSQKTWPMLPTSWWMVGASVVVYLVAHIPYVLLALKLVGVDVDNRSDWVENLSSQDLQHMTLLFTMGILMSMITLFLYPALMIKWPKGGAALFPIKWAIMVFLNHKWLTVMAIIYFFTVFFFGTVLVAQVAALMPVYMHDLVFKWLHAIERTCFYIFILRLFVYLNMADRLAPQSHPLSNSDCS